jgi:hypothetical protein
MASLLSLDYFRIQPSKWLEQTISGAIISVITVLSIIWLIFSETNYLINSEVKTELMFENLHVDHILVNMDIDVYNLPCEIVDIQFKGTTTYNNVVNKYQIMDKNSKPLSPLHKLIKNSLRAVYLQAP